MNQLEELGRAAATQPPTQPRLEQVERRAAQRSRRRLSLAASTCAIAVTGALWLLPLGSTDQTVIAADDTSEPAAAIPSVIVSEIMDGYLPEHAASLPDGVFGIDEQDPPLDLDSVALFPNVSSNLDIAVVPSIDRSTICMLAITPTGTGFTCGLPDDFARDGFVTHIGDDLAGIDHTIAAVPAGTEIGPIGDAIIDPSGLIVVWENQNVFSAVQVTNGRLTVSEEATEPVATATTYRVADDVPGDPADRPVGQRITLGPDCALSVRVYNGAGRLGVAGQLTDDINNSIALDPELDGAPLDPRDTALSDDPVTWILSDATACGDLTQLGIPEPTTIIREAPADTWAELDPEWTDSHRLAIVLGRRYDG